VKRARNTGRRNIGHIHKAGRHLIRHPPAMGAITFPGKPLCTAREHRRLRIAMRIHVGGASPIAAIAARNSSSSVAMVAPPRRNSRKTSLAGMLGTKFESWRQSATIR